MLTVTVFGIDWYLVLDKVPTWVTFRLRQITDKYGNDLDANPAAVAIAAGGSARSQQSPDPLGIAERLR